MSAFRILAITLVLALGSLMAAAAGPPDKDDKEKDKDKKKNEKVYTVPEGRSSPALLFTLGALGLGVTRVIVSRRAKR